MIVKCLIIDDEQLARDLLRTYCNKIQNLEVVAECKSPIEAIDILQQKRIDLLFLDIQMPDLNGIDLLKTLSTRPQVILTTAYSEYALEGYELSVIDYLLKPIPFERFIQACNKAIENLKPAPTDCDNDYIILKSDRKVYKLRYNDILYIEGLKEYVSYFTQNRRIVVLQSLKSIEESLPKDQFVRIHKSYIINKHYVTVMNGNQVEILNKKIPIGKSYKEGIHHKVFS